MTTERTYLDSEYNEPRLIDVKERGWQFYLNQFGYRDVKGKEWKLEDINNSILLLGCSQTFGQYLNIEDTAAYKLQQQTGIQVINLARPAAGMEYLFVKTIQVLENHSPLAMIYNYPTPERYLNWVSHYTSSPIWKEEHNDMDKWVINNEDQVSAKANYLRRSINMMCKGKTHIIELSWCDYWKYNDVYHIKKLDSAGDGNHWGEWTNQKAVDEYIIPMLKIKGILD